MRVTRDVELMQQRKRVRRRLWIVGIVLAIMTIIVIILMAWFGSHNWFRSDRDGDGR